MAVVRGAASGYSAWPMPGRSTDYQRLDTERLIKTAPQTADNFFQVRAAFGVGDPHSEFIASYSCEQVAVAEMTFHSRSNFLQVQNGDHFNRWPLCRQYRMDTYGTLGCASPELRVPQVVPSPCLRLGVCKGH
jgi:hypothetical protein